MKDRFKLFFDLVSKNRMVKDPAQVYIGKVARHNQKITNEFFNKNHCCSGERVGEF